MNRRGSVLVAVLWCMVLLSVIVIGILHSSRLDLIIVKNYGDRTQAHYLALAGIEKAKALLYQDLKDRTHSGQNHSGQLYDAQQQFKDVSFGRGKFSVVHPGGADNGNAAVYGISDEESRLNINTIGTNELGKLPGMSREIMAAIMDWRDGDNTASPGGAEAEYYESLQPPYEPRNGPVQTLKELLMVRGVTREILLGNGVNPTGPLDLGEMDEENPDPNASDTGWSALLTINSTTDNVNASGQDRVNIQTADESALTGVKGITADIARAIIAYRGQNRFQSIADLLDVTAAQANQNPTTTRGGRGAPPPQTQSSSGTGGPKVISESLFGDIADYLTAQEGQSAAGLINVNTASAQVLSWLPGMDNDIAQAIVTQRKSNGYFQSIAGLLKVPGMNASILKQVAPRLTMRSETIRIRSEGMVNSSHAKQHIEVVVHVGQNGIQMLSYEEGL